MHARNSHRATRLLHARVLPLLGACSLCPSPTISNELMKRVADGLLANKPRQTVTTEVRFIP
jgi:hypothetical protein